MESPTPPDRAVAPGGMFAFSAPVEEILFSLHHVANAGRLENWDRDASADILRHFGAFAAEVIAPLYASGDREGARLENGRVRMPAGFAHAYRQLARNGWQGLTAPAEMGGMEASTLIAAGVSEIFTAANHAMQVICSLAPGTISTLRRYGTPAQQRHWIPKLAAGEALSTMCLTEPQAGSDLSAVRCKARHLAGRWIINGEKIFISGGDQDLSESILHLVLARTGELESGTKGLSLFLCPAQAEIRIARLEEKMGLHAAPTCHLLFDGARAELIGRQGEGLRAIFTLMNHARLDVALQGVAHASRCAGLAATYTAERRQGKRRDGSPARLQDHSDIRRMLNHQKSLAVGARAMCHIALVEMESGTRPALVEFLTSLCKIFASEAGIQAADMGMQMLGGYGYLKEYLLEQHLRDVRVTAIYEGANGIHARSLVARGLRANGGGSLFPELICELANGSETVLVGLAEWRHLHARTSTSSDPAALAHEFSRASGRLFFKAA